MALKHAKKANGNRGATSSRSPLRMVPAAIIHTQLFPRFVRSCFIREDYGYSDADVPGWLYGRKEPAQGLSVKVQVNFANPRRRAMQFDGERTTTWALMGGEVRKVLSRKEVIVRVGATSDNYPICLDGDWDIVLRYTSAWSNPWVMIAMARSGELPRAVQRTRLFYRRTRLT